MMRTVFILFDFRLMEHGLGGLDGFFHCAIFYLRKSSSSAGKNSLPQIAPINADFSAGTSS